MSLKGPHGINIRKAYDPSTTLLNLPLGIGKSAETDKGEFVFAQANGAIAYGAFCKIDDDGQATELTNAISGSEPTLVGACQTTAGLADNEYGYFAVQGGGSGKGIVGKVLANCAADAKLECTATAGALDDTSGSGDVVLGAKCVTANGGSTGTVEIWMPNRMMTNPT